MRAHASRTQKHACRLLRLSQRTCFQWKPESTLPRGLCVDYIFSKQGPYQCLCLVLHQSSSTGGLKKKQISNRKESKPLLCLAELQLANTESVLLQNTAQPARAGNKDLALRTQHRGTDQEGEEQWGGEPSEKTHLVHQHYKPKFTWLVFVE